MLFNRITFCLILFIVFCIFDKGKVLGAYHHEHLKEGDECQDEVTGQLGVCTPINYCQSAFGDHRSRLNYYLQNGTTCWYGKGDVILCCPERDPNYVPPNERTISQKKCLEYNDDALMWFVDTPPPQPASPPPPSPARNLSVTFSQYGVRGNGRAFDYSYFRRPVISGGEQVHPHEFPHMAALGWRTRAGHVDFKCGGTLVSPLFVLTAGHCTEASSRDTELASAVPTVVRLGVNDLSAEGSDRQDASIRRIVQHPAYKSPAIYNDIALIELEAPVELNHYVMPACLWHKDDFGGIKTGEISGWGITSESSTISTSLLKAFVTLFTNEYCETLLKDKRSRKWKHGVSPEQVCAGDRGTGQDTCMGDSGGPLQIMLKSEPSVFHIIGITSFGDGCPAVSGVSLYTRVSSFVPWIESVVWPDEEDSK